jgi:hypothetical protein
MTGEPCTGNLQARFDEGPGRITPGATLLVPIFMSSQGTAVIEVRLSRFRDSAGKDCMNRADRGKRVGIRYARMNTPNTAGFRN